MADGLDDLPVGLHKKEDAEDKGCHLGDGEGKPYGIENAGALKQPCGRQKNKQLARDRDDH